MRDVKCDAAALVSTTAQTGRVLSVRLSLHPRFRVHSSCPPFPCACRCSHAVQRRRVHPAWLPVGSPEARPGNTMISATVACLPAGHPAGHASLHQLASRCCLCLCVVTLTPVPVNVHHIQYCTAGAAAQTRIQFAFIGDLYPQL